MDICGDDRFEIIAKAKAHLLEATNIDTSPDEMKVLDNFLFRCWQMGWLDRYEVAEQTEPSCQKCKWWNSEELKCSISSVSDCDFEQTEPSTDCGWK